MNKNQSVTLSVFWLGLIGECLIRFGSEF